MLVIAVVTVVVAGVVVLRLQAIAVRHVRPGGGAASTASASRWMDTLFALALAATIVASMNVVGVTLIAAAS